MKLQDCCTIIAGQSPESQYYNSEGIGLLFFKEKQTSEIYTLKYVSIVPDQQKLLRKMIFCFQSGRQLALPIWHLVKSVLAAV